MTRRVALLTAAFMALNPLPIVGDAASAGIEQAPVPGSFGATYLDPYSVFNASVDRLDAMFESQKRAGIDTVIVQWTGAMRSNGDVVTTYPASPSTGFGAWDSVLPRLLAAADRQDVDVWLGLVLKSSVLDDEQTRGDESLLDAIVDANQLISGDLLSKYAGQFSGWYIPTEPGYATVADPELLELHTEYVRAVTNDLKQLDVDLPVMISPSVPRAIEGGKGGVEFVEALRPMIEESGVDIWNLQDGFEMTAWTPQENHALVERGQEIASAVGAETWVTLYAPGPSDPNYPLSSAALLADLQAVTATGAIATMWTFDSAMNPDPTRAGYASRIAFYDWYLDVVSPS